MYLFSSLYQCSPETLTLFLQSFLRWNPYRTWCRPLTLFVSVSVSKGWPNQQPITIHFLLLFWFKEVVAWSVRECMCEWQWQERVCVYLCVCVCVCGLICKFTESNQEIRNYWWFHVYACVVGVDFYFGRPPCKSFEFSPHAIIHYVPSKTF